MPDYPITSGTVTTPFCPTTWQQVLEELAARMTVTLPSISGFIAQAATPDVADQDKVWVKTSASAPYVLGFYRFEGGAWRLIPAPVTATYFVDTGAANTWTITTGESIPNNAAYITGRIWIVRVANDVSGATTLQIDSFAAKSVKKRNSIDLVGGDLYAGQLALVVYDATSDVFELVTTLGVPPTGTACAVLKYSTATGGAAQVISATSATKVEFNTEVDPDNFVTLNTSQFTLTTGTYQIAAHVPIHASVAATSPHSKILLIDVTGGSSVIADASDFMNGGSNTGDNNSWCPLEHVVKIAGATNTYELQIYSSQAVTLGSPVNLVAYNETYQQLSITKLA